jgi:hypothetical protein
MQCIWPLAMSSPPRGGLSAHDNAQARNLDVAGRLRRRAEPTLDQALGEGGERLH